MLKFSLKSSCKLNAKMNEAFITSDLLVLRGKAFLCSVPEVIASLSYMLNNIFILLLKTEPRADKNFN